MNRATEAEMRLSEAIRLGAMLAPQAFGTFYQRDRAGVRMTCALGAALDAIGCRLEGNRIWHYADAVHSSFSIAGEPTTCPLALANCPACGPLLAVVAHLNDDHRWTREQIADYVEGIERVRESRIENPIAVAVSA